VRNPDTWAQPNRGMPKIPKIREYTQKKMSDGSILNGYVFVEAMSRIQDVLNGATQFIPFIDENKVTLGFNCTSSSVRRLVCCHHKLTNNSIGGEAGYIQNPHIRQPK
jgi:hypothetical protein